MKFWPSARDRWVSHVALSNAGSRLCRATPRNATLGISTPAVSRRRRLVRHAPFGSDPIITVQGGQEKTQQRRGRHGRTTTTANLLLLLLRLLLRRMDQAPLRKGSLLKVGAVVLVRSLLLDGLRHAAEV